MTPHQVAERFEAIRKSLPPNFGCDIWLHDSATSPSPFTVVFHRNYPAWEVVGRGKGSTWDALLDNADALAANITSEQRAATTSKMAKVIIDRYAEHSECTRGHLKQFGAFWVDLCLKDALAEANRIAGLGPYTVAESTSDNGGPNDEWEE